MSETVNLLLSSGHGPEECRMALQRLVVEIRREADQFGLTCHCASSQGDYPASVIVTIEGSGAENFARTFEGTMRFTFKSPVRPGHKRQNWFVGASLVTSSSGNQHHTATLNEADIKFETMRAGGPGGQHQNTTDSAVRATHLPTGLVTVARQERSQHMNKKLAVSKISAMLEMLDVYDREQNKKSMSKIHHALERGNEVRHYKGI